MDTTCRQSDATTLATYKIQPILNQQGFYQQRRKQLSACATYRLPKFSEKGAIFLLAWNLIFTTSLTMCCTNTLLDYSTAIEFPAIVILCPIIGLLSDCWIGRFKVLKAATYFLLVAIILKGVTIINPSSVVLYLAVAAWTLSFTCYFTCIIQFTTDQLIGASGEELSFAIYWLLWGFTTGDLIHKIAGCLPRENDQQTTIITFAGSTLTFIIAFIMIENCNSLLATKPQPSNPIKQIDF